MPISKGKVNRSLDLCLMAKETTGDCEEGFVFKHVYLAFMTSSALLVVAELRWACGLMSHLLQVTSSYESIQISPI